MYVAMNQHEVEEYVKCLLDPEYFVDHYCWVENKASREIIPFKMGNTPDEDYYFQREILRWLKDGKNVFMLKSRRVGGSWVGAAYGAWLVNFHQGVNVLFISRTEEAAVTLLSKVKFILGKLADRTVAEDHALAPPADFLRAEIISNTRTQLAIGWRNDDGEIMSTSIIKSLTSSPNAAVGEGATFIMIDEFAVLEHDKEIWRAARPTIARGGQWLGITTPRPGGTVAYNLVRNAEEGKNIGANGKPTYILRKVHWSEAGMTHEMIQDMSQEMSHDDIRQEWELEFLQSGRPVFNLVDLTACYKPLDKNPEIKEYLAKYRETVLAETSGLFYTIGVDTAVGKVNRKSSEKDYHSLCVMTLSGVQAYALHSKDPISRWAGEIRYGDDDEMEYSIGLVSQIHKDYPGYMVIEENGPGEVVLQNHVLPEDGISEVRRHHTNSKTKVRIITNLIRAVESHAIIITDPFTFECMKNYQHGKTPGTFAAESGKYDDPVISLALAFDAVIKFGGFDLEMQDTVGILSRVGTQYHYNEDNKMIARTILTENDIRADDLLAGPQLINTRLNGENDIFTEAFDEDLVSFLLGKTGDMNNVRKSSMSKGRLFQEIKNRGEVL